MDGNYIYSMRGKRGLLIMAVVTLVGFPLIGFVANWFFRFVAVDSLLDTSIGYGKELIFGAIFGVVAALVGWTVVQLPLLKGAYDDISDKIAAFNLSVWDVVFISLCAGIGEEILFRGFVQPVLGVWLTAVIFVAIHGYLRPDHWRRSIYGIYMTLVIAVLGYMREYWGLISAMAAHAVIDMVLFYFTLREADRIHPNEEIGAHHFIPELWEEE